MGETKFKLCESFLRSACPYTPIVQNSKLNLNKSPVHVCLGLYFHYLSSIRGTTHWDQKKKAFNRNKQFKGSKAGHSLAKSLKFPWKICRHSSNRCDECRLCVITCTWPPNPKTYFSFYLVHCEMHQSLALKNGTPHKLNKTNANYVASSWHAHRDLCSTPWQQRPSQATWWNVPSHENAQL